MDNGTLQGIVRIHYFDDCSRTKMLSMKHFIKEQYVELDLFVQVCGLFNAIA